jgi:hypothetical protein
MQDTELSCRSYFVFQSVVFTFQLAVHIPALREQMFWCVARTQFVLFSILFEGGLLCVGN